VNGLVVSLRCVEEKHVQDGDSTKIEYQHKFEETRTVSTDPLGMAHLDFDVPADAPGNQLLDGPARYWELEAKADLPGADYAATFLLPVYTVMPVYTGPS
jgi:hypothetical protein